MGHQRSKGQEERAREVRASLPTYKEKRGHQCSRSSDRGRFETYRELNDPSLNGNGVSEMQLNNRRI